MIDIDYLEKVAYNNTGMVLAKVPRLLDVLLAKTNNPNGKYKKFSDPVTFLGFSKRYLKDKMLHRPTTSAYNYLVDRPLELNKKITNIDHTFNPTNWNVDKSVKINPKKMSGVEMSDSGTLNGYRLTRQPKISKEKAYLNSEYENLLQRQKNNQESEQSKQWKQQINSEIDSLRFQEPKDNIFSKIKKIFKP